MLGFGVADALGRVIVCVGDPDEVDEVVLVTFCVGDTVAPCVLV
jgi:hypothetical protein